VPTPTNPIPRSGRLESKKIRGPDPIEGVPAYCKLSCDLSVAKLASMTAALAASTTAGFVSGR
jgi:hypothetical protein